MNDCGDPELAASRLLQRLRGSYGVRSREAVRSVQVSWLRGFRTWCWLHWQPVRVWIFLQLQRALLWVSRRMVDWIGLQMMRSAALDDTGRDFEFWMQQHRGWKQKLQRSRVNLGTFREELKAVRRWVHCLRKVPLRVLPYQVARSLRHLEDETPVVPRAVPARSQPN